MSNISEIYEYSKNKTRVLMYTSVSSAMKILVSVLGFHNKNFDFFSENNFSKNPENDFVILETSDLKKAAAFKPNIVFISNEIPLENVIPFLPNITSGGVLIYPENIENEIENTENYFRKIPFSKSEFQKTNDSYLLNTEIGMIPLITIDENLIENVNGIKFLCQQFGIMEEDFYEAVMNFIDD